MYHQADLKLKTYTGFVGKQHIQIEIQIANDTCIYPQ